MYQRKIKLYKGTDNDIEIEVRNSEQRRTDVQNNTLLINFYDSEHQKVISTRALPAFGKHGIMVAKITEQELEILTPQHLSAVALLESQNSTALAYSGADFDLAFSVEIIDGFNDSHPPLSVIDTLTTFNYEFDRKSYVSEIGRFGTRINDDLSSDPISTVTVEYQGDFQGIITVEATNTMSTAYGIKWTKLQDWDVAQENQKVYSGDFRFLRFVYPKYRDINYTQLTGNIDKIFIRN